MTVKNIFSSQLELANALVNSDSLQQAWNAIKNHPHPDEQEPSLYNMTTLPESNCTVISFVASASASSQIQGKESLVNSSTDSTLEKFKFLCSEKITSFSASEAAVSDFSSQFDQLDLLTTKLVEISNRKPTPSIIITGHGLGGCLAMLFALWLLKSLDSSKRKRLLCITFGAPLLGDENLRQLVSKLSSWNYCFLHVLSNKDPTPKMFHGPDHKPFGTFLLCSDSGCACSEKPAFILKQLVASNSQSPQDQGLDYGKVLEDLKLRALCNNSSMLVSELDPLLASIKTQLRAIGVVLPQKEIDSWKSEHEKKVLIQRKKLSDSDEKLNKMKMNMAKLEWYKKEAKQNNIGYYDMYKNQGKTSDVDVNGVKRMLTNYWEDSVTEVEDVPQIEGAPFKTRWLYGGTNCRRMIEPLHIADFYQDGGTNYISGGKRPIQFIRLEQWLKKKEEEDEKKKQEKKRKDEEKKKQETEKTQARTSKKTREKVSDILTEDSCFWAHVEEAIILCNLLKNEGSTTDPTDAEKEGYREKLKEFEAYVWNGLKSYEVSSEIFLEGSTFMRWWKEYQGVTADPSASLLGQFMKTRSYRKYGVEDLVFA